ncbi:MAG: type II secretion system F family protein [Candidatus Omnitrophica bacterium]|nr:type II secretion system F family protein [Candidatus Omnitrophota bacterium]
MPRYLYKAKKGPREITEGEIDADSESQALAKIGALGLFPVSIRQKGGTDAEIKEVAPLGFLGRVKTSDLAVFTRQLADLLESGITIVNGLDILEKQTENKKLKAIIAELSDHIRGGGTLAASLDRYPAVFPPLYISMVRSGEASGAIEKVLNRLADFMEQQEEFKTKVQAALAYPILMACVGVITIVVLLTFVMPRVVGIFEDLGQSLPVLTLILLGISNFIRQFWYVVIALLLFLFFVIKQVSRTQEGKAFLDKLKNDTPLMGPLLKKTDIARFAGTLATLLNNGVTILHSLEIVEGIMSSEAAKKDIRAAFTKVRDGASLARALAEGQYFPLFVTNMISVGEESGQLERALFKVADSYERQTNKMIKIISSLIEPVMILVMGLMVGFIVISILLPIFQISLIAK